MFSHPPDAHGIKAACGVDPLRAFRGSYNMLVALHDIAVITTALEIKLEFELDNKAMFEVVGPWPHTFYP